MHLSILVAYGWNGLPTNKDPKWSFLRNSLASIGSEVESMAKKCRMDVRVSVGRLRARHGGCVLQVIKRRIASADILVFDLGDDNRNVYFELGLAMAIHAESQNLFVLRRVGQPSASDLSGLLFTEYNDKPAYKLTDLGGFRAAVRSELLWKLRQQGCTLVDPGEDAVVKIISANTKRISRVNKSGTRKIIKKRPESQA